MDRFTQTPTFAVLLLHGLYAKVDELKPIAAALHKQFGKKVLVIQPTCRVRLKSVIRSITQQAEDVFRQTQLEYKRYNKEASSFPLIIIGYSQGGVLACTLGKCYKSHLNIAGIITLNAPLMGTPLLKRSRRDLQEFIANAAAGLQLIGYPLSRIKWSMTLQAWMLLLTRPRWVPINGLKDIAPSSACIEDVGSFLQDNQEIPCLLVATHQNDFLALFDIKTANQHSAIAALNSAYALFITGQEDGKHDTLIPLASQLARKDYAHNLIPIYSSKHSAMARLNHPQVKRQVYKGIIHAHNLVAIDPRLFVDHGQMVLYTDLILTDLIQFIKTVV
ncbi:MAG: hypothetical protein NMK33_05455 [Candidatus Cardinium sp.]|uniref:hypothetical protein n=1 Tax=Cardinium endosymbiont of Dermatophagoides farinae TaxID=2597823 RepID=UPI001183DBCB|nr:hypothetical protein [Cardinium endosymbiont of Dermatophagoides farinae]TSJ80859.1 hypothetical protein FPG78_02260 [Cardinium endosymbiont of Dermatophagoides farinae]UWW96864.1 MAG: hypothetical protein NMK33_05455 [Candidatus Cardinium sp.]